MASSPLFNSLLLFFYLDESVSIVRFRSFVLWYIINGRRIVVLCFYFSKVLCIVQFFGIRIFYTFNLRFDICEIRREVNRFQFRMAGSAQLCPAFVRSHQIQVDILLLHDNFYLIIQCFSFLVFCFQEISICLNNFGRWFFREITRISVALDTDREFI